MADIKSWTGERLETYVFNENTNEHLHRYAIAMQLVAGKNVLDIACGEGYGSSLIADAAKAVTGVDIDPTTITLATQKYQKQNLSFLTGSAAKILCDDNCFDVVISFETIEHHDKHDEMMQEIKRVLKPGGVLIISSPDKLFYSDKPGFKNPFHVKELYRHEFETLLGKYFRHTFYMGQKSFFGSVVLPCISLSAGDNATVYEGDYQSINASALEPVYLIALASDAPLPTLGASVLNGDNVLKMQFEQFRLEVTKDAVDTITRELRSSWSFRIGHFILSPVRLIKSLFHA